MAETLTNKRPISHFYKTYLRGEVLYGFWNIVATGVGFLNTFITLTALTVYQYGVFQLILASYAGLSVFLTLGAGTIRNDILRYVGEGRIGHAKKLFYEASAIRIAIGIVLCMLVVFAAPRLFNYGPDFIYYIKLFSFLFMVDSIWPSVQLTLEADRKFGLVASRAPLGKVVQFAILGYFFLFARVGLEQVITSVVISSACILIVLVIYVGYRYTRLWGHIPATKEKLLHRILLSYGKWELLQPVAAKFTNFVQVWLTKIFISTEAVAVFSVAQTMIGILGNLLPDNTLSALVPREVGDNVRMQKILNTGSKYMLALSVVLAAGALVLTPPFIHIFFPKYNAALPLFSVMLVTLPIIALGAVPSVILTVYRKQGFLLLQKLFKGLIGAILYVIFIPFFGMWGLVIQTLILSVVLYSILYTYMRKSDLGIKIDWQHFLTFGESDKILLKGMYSDGVRYVNKWMFWKKQAETNIQ